MVAKVPTIPNRMNAAVNPILVRETIQKVEKCMARLQELQFTVTGGTKFISGVKLSPRSTRGYIRTSLRCKEESLRMKTVGAQRSPPFKFQEKAKVEEWRRMSLSAMLLSETVDEILQASKLVSKLSITSTDIGPRTPDTDCRSRKLENTELRAKRAKEKQLSSRTLRLESGSPVLRRARSRISFKTTSPLSIREASMNITGTRPSVSVNRIRDATMSITGARPSVSVRVSPKNRPWMKKTVLFPNPLFHSSVSVNRVSPKNRPWMKKTVLFPNPLFHSTSPTSTHPKSFFKTRSPIIARPSQTPHKFFIKHQNTSLRSHFKSKKAVPEVTVSPVKTKGPASKQRRCSFSPSKFANRLVSPLKARLSFHKGVGGLMTGLKQRPSCSTAMNRGL